MGRPYSFSNGNGIVNEYTIIAIKLAIDGGVNVRLNLRKLEDMTEEEIWGLSGLDGRLVRASNEGSFFQVEYILDGEQQYTHWYKHHLTSEQFHYLLSLGFDLFSLIESGSAIDIKTLQTQQQ